MSDHRNAAARYSNGATVSDAEEIHKVKSMKHNCSRLELVRNWIQTPQATNNTSNEAGV